MNTQLTLLFLTALAGIVYGYSWHDHKTKFGLTFSSAEEHDKRQSIFNSNIAKIDRHNQLAAQGHVSYTKSLNQFSHLTYAEAVASSTGYKSRQRRMLHHESFLQMAEDQPSRSARQANCNCTCPTTTTTGKLTTTTTLKPTTTTTTTGKLTTTISQSSSSVDLRNTAMVGPIKDQGGCG